MELITLVFLLAAVGVCGGYNIYFKSGEISNIIFSVRLTSDGKLEIENVSQVKNG